MVCWTNGRVWLMTEPHKLQIAKSFVAELEISVVFYGRKIGMDMKDRSRAQYQPD
jgi:hypothetical protein